MKTSIYVTYSFFFDVYISTPTMALRDLSIEVCPALPGGWSCPVKPLGFRVWGLLRGLVVMESQKMWGKISLKIRNYIEIDGKRSPTSRLTSGGIHL